MEIIILKKFKKNDAPASIWTNPVHFIACGFGVGSIPIAPGTFGTLMAVPIYLALARLGWWWYAVILVAYTVLAMYCISKTDKDWQTHDHPATVSDEIVGYLVTMFFIPVNFWMILAGFILFRVFDIFKPWPIGWVDKHMSGGLGVVLDDVLAGVYAWMILRLWLHTGWY